MTGAELVRERQAQFFPYQAVYATRFATWILARGIIATAQSNRELSVLSRGTITGRDPIPQTFGGPWTLIKTDIVAAYLRAFTTALKNQGFVLAYIDAFAGSGEFSFEQAAAPLFDDAATIAAHAGSARNALAVTPPFDELIFLEEKPRNIRSLTKLITKQPRARVIPGDANKAIIELCKPEHWRPRKRRGVIFLDPFGLSVEWSTLEAIARTKALDLWYLFSLAGLYRNAPLSIDALEPDKRIAITRTLGAENWVADFYGAPASTQASLFGPETRRTVRTLSVNDIEEYVHRRLSTIFPYVARPRRLSGPTNAPLFSLFFAVANPDHRAQGLAKQIAEHIIKSHTP